MPDSLDIDDSISFVDLVDDAVLTDPQPISARRTVELLCAFRICVVPKPQKSYLDSSPSRIRQSAERPTRLAG